MYLTAGEASLAPTTLDVNLSRTVIIAIITFGDGNSNWSAIHRFSYSVYCGAWREVSLHSGDTGDSGDGRSKPTP